MLRQRVLTALLIVIPLALLIGLGPTWLFGAVVFGVMLLGAAEWARLSGLSTPVARMVFVILLAGLVGVLLLLAVRGWSTVHLAVLGLALLWWLVVFIGLTTYRVGLATRPWGRGLLRVAGFLTLVPAALALVWLHATSPMLVFYLIILVAAADTGAYFVGRRFGRSPLAPEISPGKTREGLLGALFTVIPVAAGGAWSFDFLGMDALVFGLLSLVVALVSVAGDLQESVLKREAGAKDSGTLLPGHGGILDRIDSLTAAAPVFLIGLLWLALWPAGTS